MQLIMRAINEQTTMLSPELESVMHLMSDYPARWAVCGGWAIDLFLDQMTRPHKDVDLSVLRKDQALLQSHMAGWTLEIADQGELISWEQGQVIELPLHTIWCKNFDYDPDFVEFLLDEADETHYVFRRNPAITRDLERAFLTSPSGIPILAPEIVLLYKSKQPDGASADFANTLPHLNAKQRDWLQQALQQEYDTHPWLTTIESISQ